MFVFEDPGKKESVFETELKQSKARSYASTVGHFRRRGRLKSLTQDGVTSLPTSPDPEYSPSLQVTTKIDRPLSFGPNQSLHPARAVQYFLRQTVMCCSGWDDEYFWSQLVPCVAIDHVAVQNAIVSIGAFHRSLLLQDTLEIESSKTLSLSYADKAFAALRRDHDYMSLSALLVAHIVIAKVAAFLDDKVYNKALEIELDLMRTVEKRYYEDQRSVSSDDWHFICTYINPIIRQQRSREGQYLDPIWCLRNTEVSHFFVDESETPRFSIETVQHAHKHLEVLLKKTTFLVKAYDPPLHTIIDCILRNFQQWSTDVAHLIANESLSKRDQFRIRLLKVAAKLNFMMIATMSTEDEMIFDSFTEDFRELADVTQTFMNCSKRSSRGVLTFGVTPGLLCLLSSCALRWCRDPTVRASLIDVLTELRMLEGIEGSLLWAQAARYIQALEESGGESRPLTCRDILKEHRVRVISLALFEKSGKKRIEYLRYPWSSQDVCELWLPRIAGKSLQLLETTDADTVEEDPVFILGRGYVKYLRTEQAGHYYSVGDVRFSFPLPKL